MAKSFTSQASNPLIAQEPNSSKPQRKSRKAPGIKAAVIQQRLSNKSKRQISQELGITRNTVTTILEESNVEQALKSFSEQSVELVPEALRVMKVRLGMNSENAAIKTLESTIWPIQGKQGKAGDPGLVLAIQNLMGNITVQSQGNQQDKLVNSANEASTPVSTEPLPIMQTSPQVVENKEERS